MIELRWENKIEMLWHDFDSLLTEGWNQIWTSKDDFYDEPRSGSHLTEALNIGGRSNQESSANPFTPLIGFAQKSIFIRRINTKASGNNFLASVSIDGHSTTGNDLK